MIEGEKDCLVWREKNKNYYMSDMMSDRLEERKIDCLTDFDRERERRCKTDKEKEREKNGLCETDWQREEERKNKLYDTDSKKRE